MACDSNCRPPGSQAFIHQLRRSLSFPSERAGHRVDSEGRGPAVGPHHQGPEYPPQRAGAYCIRIGSTARLRCYRERYDRSSRRFLSGRYPGWCGVRPVGPDCCCSQYPEAASSQSCCKCDRADAGVTSVRRTGAIQTALLDEPTVPARAIKPHGPFTQRGRAAASTSRFKPCAYAVSECSRGLASVPAHPWPASPVKNPMGLRSARVLERVVAEVRTSVSPRDPHAGTGTLISVPPPR